MGQTQLTEGAVKAREWRESRGLTQQQVADQATTHTGRQVSRSLINEIEAGRSRARLDLAEFYWNESNGFVSFTAWNRPSEPALQDVSAEKGAAA
jgi:transcriptional regulator with XRE-family HTH domain